MAACDSYLKTYPKGKHVEEVKAKKAQLEAHAKPESAAKSPPSPSCNKNEKIL